MLPTRSTHLRYGPGLTSPVGAGSSGRAGSRAAGTGSYGIERLVIGAAAAALRGYA